MIPTALSFRRMPKKGRFLQLSCRVCPLLLALFLLPVFFGCSLSQQAGKATPENPASSQNTQVASEGDEKGALFWQKGDFVQAILYWSEAARLYEQEGNQRQQCRVLDNLSQAYQAVGQLRKAAAALETARLLAEATGNKDQSASVLGHLGNLHQALGNRDLAQQYLQQGLQLAREGAHDKIAAAIYNNLGNFFSSAEKYTEAADAYRESMVLSRMSNKPLLQATALVNYAMAIMHKGHYKEALSSLDQARETLRQTEDSHDQAYASMNIGLSYAALNNYIPESKDDLLVLASEVIAKAAGVADRINDYRASSYALGYAGKLYEDQHRYEAALELTRQAVLAAQQAGASEALYRWQWQTGRLFKQLGKMEDAIAAYRRTVYTLQSIRQEMDACAENSPSLFRKTAGSVCFELVDLLLQRAAAEENPEQYAGLLMEARDLVELLRVYELRDYFKDDCVDTARSSTVQLDSLCRTTAVIYPVLLQDRTELLVSLPTGLKQFSLLVDNQTLIREVRDFRRKLEKRTTWEFLPHAQKLYDYLIRPLEADLTAQKVDTLVFVPGGALRTIPLAALHDGKQFLNNTYATAVTPGLNLTDPCPIDRQEMFVLIAGLTQTTQGFPPLPFVRLELQAIANLCRSSILVDENFVVSNFKESLQKEKFNILHIASHGQFLSDVDQTFILTFDDKVTMARLDEYIGFLQFRREPLDLLVLSACETAAGDDLAALGLAGVAVKAGARSALATLWHINDAATSILIEEFYRQIQNPSISRAAALRQAQLKLGHDPRYEHPAYWSPFLLINNWL